MEVKKQNPIRKVAFTLAEVLITLGIIGVVAALTLPSLIQNYREKETVTRVKAAYSILGQAFQRAITEDGTPDNWGMSGMYDETTHEILANKIIPYMKVTDNCIGMDATQVRKICKPSKTAYENKFSYSVVRLVNGTVVIFRNYTPTCNWNFSGGKGGALANVCGTISIDINGNGKPNISGEDIFVFYVTKNAIIPMGAADDVAVSFNTYCDSTKAWGFWIGSMGTNGTGCAAWVISNENMDYLHCDGLSWGGKHSCKE